MTRETLAQVIQAQEPHQLLMFALNPTKTNAHQVSTLQ